MKINLLGLFYEHSGYGKMAREYALALYRQGIGVAAVSLTKSKIKEMGLRDKDYYILKEIDRVDLYEAPVVWLHTPESYHWSLSPICNIGYCELESDRLPSKWVENCNLMQEIWVPTEFFKKAAESSGVKTRIEVIPQGIDTEVFNPSAKPFPMKINQKFKFFMNGEFIPRKNFKMALEAFWDTFTNKDDVCMILKTYDLSDPNFETNIPKKIKEWKRDRKNTAPVYLLNAFIKDRLLPRLYTAIDCLVHPAAGEGWGFPPLEALACERPVIYTGWGSLGEILHSGSGYRLNYKLVDIPKFGIPNDKLFAGAKWAEPSGEELRAYMKKIYNDYDQAKQKAELAREELTQNLSWDKTARKIVGRLRDIEANRKRGLPRVLMPKPPSSGRIRLNIVCPSLGKTCGIATYTEGLLSEFGYKSYHAGHDEVMTNESDFSKYDILHLQFQYGLYTNLILEEMLYGAKVKGKTIVVTMHDFGETACEHNNSLKKYADRIIVHSHNQKEVLVNNGFNGDKICVIPHGIDKDLYLKNREKKIRYRKGLIGYFGFAYDHKGLIELGMAIKDMANMVMCELELKALCAIGVSSRTSLEYWEKVRKFFNRQNIWPYVDMRTRFLSEEKLVEELSECELIVMPYEDYGQVGISGAIRKAMLADRPIVVTDTPFFSDLADGQEVFKIKNNWPETIKEGILKFLGRKTPDGLHARILMDSWASVAEKHGEVYLK